MSVLLQIPVVSKQEITCDYQWIIVKCFQNQNLIFTFATCSNSCTIFSSPSDKLILGILMRGLLHSTFPYYMWLIRTSKPCNVYKLENFDDYLLLIPGNFSLGYHRSSYMRLIQVFYSFSGNYVLSRYTT